MPNPSLPRKHPLSPGCAASLTRTTVLLMVGAVCLGGCAGSSGNTTAMNSAGYNAHGVSEVNADSVNATSFAPTATAAAHSSDASVAADKLTSVATPGNAAYKIGPADVLDISVFKVPDLAKTVQVADDGTINYPLIGEVPVAGKTAHDLERDLAQKLGVKYLRSPQVSVLVKEFNSQRVTVSGSVKTAGGYRIKGTQELCQSGGEGRRCRHNSRLGQCRLISNTRRPAHCREVRCRCAQGGKSRRSANAARRCRRRRHIRHEGCLGKRLEGAPHSDDGRHLLGVMCV